MSLAQLHFGQWRATAALRQRTRRDGAPSQPSRSGRCASGADAGPGGAHAEAYGDNVVMWVRIPRPQEAVAAAGSLVRSGLIRLYRPDHLVRVGLGLARYQMSPATGPMAAACLYPDAPGIIDDSGSATMRELDDRCSAVADGLYHAGLRAGDAIGVLARNSRAFYEATVGASRLGLDVTYLNTGFAADQLADIVAARSLHWLIHDPEFADRVPRSLRRIVTEGERGAGIGSVAAMAVGASSPRPRPGRTSRHIILTSGTTGTPKNVARTGGGLESVVALLSGLPLRVRGTHCIAAPMFHAWGWLNMVLTMLLSGTIVVSRRFDPEATLASVARHRCDVLVAVPAMLQQIMDMPAEVRRRHDTTCLRVVAVSGSALSPSLASAFMDDFGDVLYSLYGSTEAAFATVAGPSALRRAPGTAGRPLPMVRVRVLDGAGRDTTHGEVGAIVVSSRDAVSADTGGTDRRTVRTGDLGWFDEAGRLFVAAREDDMVVVGAENVYPNAVEAMLEQHPDIVEVAVVGRADRVLGQVLVAHVVARRGTVVTAAGLREWCRTRLAPFQVPRRFVFHGKLPHGETGKIVKRSLAA
jgi:acyl-CoA synthetase (AMP-forming)/AMP-acid ligase II